MDEVRAEVAAIVTKAPFPKSLTAPHRLISGLLNEDESRRQKQLVSKYTFSWDGPVFEWRLSQYRKRVEPGVEVAP